MDDFCVLHAQKAYSPVVPCDSQELTWDEVSKMPPNEVCPLGTGMGRGQQTVGPPAQCLDVVDAISAARNELALGTPYC